MTTADVVIRGLTFKGKVARFMLDKTREISIEGGFRAGKTAAALWKVRESLKHNPGIIWFLCRYSDTDTRTKLKPAIDAWWMRYDADDPPVWDASAQCYNFANGSKAIVFGLKGVDARSRYSKLRGLGADTGVAGIMIDEAQELPEDIGRELRGRMSQSGYPLQLLFVSNPLNVTEWIAKQFPKDNKLPNRVYYAVPLSDNAHNLPDDFVQGLLASYPPEHAKHASVILGERGMNVDGTPVFEHTFNRALHVRDVDFSPHETLLEGFDFGQHNTCYVAAQRMYSGGLVFLGGVFGQELFLDDFLPTVKSFRSEWFGELDTRRTRACCPPPGAMIPSKGNRYTNVSLLRRSGFMPIFNEHSNSPDVQLALIERMAGYMRRRNVEGHEQLAINTAERSWLKASREGTEPFPFLAQAMEGGFVWDAHYKSVDNNVVRQPKADDWFIHGMRCALNIELNFCVDQPSREEIEKRSQTNRDRSGERGELARSVASWMGM